MSLQKTKTKRINELDGFIYPHSVRRYPVGNGIEKPVYFQKCVSLSYKHVRGRDSFRSVNTPMSAIKSRHASRLLSEHSYQDKCRDLEKQIRRLVLERSVLLKDMSTKDMELQKTTYKLQAVMQTKTHLQSSIAGLEKELKELKKSNDILRTKNATLENTSLKKKQIHIELANARGLVVAKDHDLCDLRQQISSLKAEQSESKQSQRQVKELEIVVKALEDKITALAKENVEIRQKECLEKDTFGEIFALPVKDTDVFEELHETKSSDDDQRYSQLECEVDKVYERYGSAVDPVHQCSPMQEYRDNLVERISLLKDHNYELEEQTDKYLHTIGALESQVNSTDETLYDALKEMEMLREQLEAMRESNANLTNEKSLLEQKSASLENDLVELGKAKSKSEDDLQEEQKTLKSSLEETEKKFEMAITTIEDLLAESKKAASKMDDVLEEIESLKSGIAVKVACLQEKEDCIGGLQTRLVERETQIKETNEQTANLVVDAEGKDQQLDKLQWQLTEAVQNCSDLKEKVSNSETALNAKQNELEAAQARIAEVVRDLERCEETVKLLEQTKIDNENNLSLMKKAVSETQTKMEESEKNLASKEDILTAIYGKLRDVEEELLEKHSVLEHYSLHIQELNNLMLAKDEQLHRFIAERHGMETNLKELEEKLVLTTEEKVSLVDNLTVMEKKLVNFESDIGSKIEVLAAVEKEKKELEVKLGELQIVLDENETHLIHLSQQSQDVLEVQQKLTSRTLELEDRLTQKDHVVVDMQRELDDAQRLNENLCTRMKQLEKRLLEKEDIIHETEMMKSELEKLLDSSSQQQSCILDQKQEIADVRERNIWLSSELDRCKANIEWFDNRKDIWIQDITAAEQKAANEKEEKQKWRQMFEELSAKVEPFKEQLDMFEAEKNALLNQNSEAFNEVAKVSKQYALLLGHQNQKQKIHHVVKLKQENIDVKKENAKCRETIAKLKKKVERLEEQNSSKLGVRRFDPMKAFAHTDKENAHPLCQTN